MGLYILFSFWNFFIKYRRAQGIARVQLRYLAIGIGAFVVAAFLFDVALPAVHIFEFNLFGPLFSIFMIGFVGYAIVRHGLLDIHVIIKRTIAYIGVLLLVAGIFFCLEFVIERFYYNDEIVDIVCAIVGAVAFSWLRSFFEKITDKIFFRKDYDYAESVRELGPLLNTTINLDVLLGILADFLSKTIKPRSVIFFFDSPPEPAVFYYGTAGDEGALDRYRSLATPFFETGRDTLLVQDMESGASREIYSGIAAIVSLRAKDRISAVMFLGGKLSDDILRPKDIKLLAVISHQAGIAIDNARLYEAVRKHTETLEDLVEERTKEVRDAYKTRSDFLTDISHQLQTPITILQGNLELAEKGRGEQTRNALRSMRNTLDDMAQLVVGFLDLARLNFPKNKFHKERFDVGELVREIYEDCLVLAETKGVALQCAADPLWISGDRRKIKEIILNLISNALKYTSRGGTVELRADEHKHDAEISVRDTGVGISPEDLSHIFERFYRIPGTHRDGNGLGLNICRQIVEFHQGTITAQSTVGVGSVFTVCLPLAAE